MNGQFMLAEIEEQPAVFERILRQGQERIQDVAAALSARRPRFILFVARGTSDHAALYAKYLAETQLGLPCGLVSPSTATVYDTHPRMEGVLYIAVSQSGGSPDLLEPLQRARAAGALTLAVTNAPHSALAEAAEFHLDILAGAERAVAATKTYTAELLTLYLLVAALAGTAEPALDELPDRAHRMLSTRSPAAELAVRYHFAEQVVLLSRGYNYPTAREGALKLMETSYLVAEGFSAADFVHGPIAMIEHGFPVITVVPDGPGRAALQPVLRQLGDLGADTLIIGPPDAAGQGTVGLPLADLGPEVLSPLLLIIPVQLLAWSLARTRGYDPDEPRGLRKVTETW
ncbi:MAG TPA: SIS domain-containing protein [Chloroflexota bacterium]|nr:SIS domain-containing protein [Chloroflexota bacterium]